MADRDSQPEAVDRGLIDYLEGFITENKRTKIAEALNYRTRHVAVVLEDIFQPHNAAACLRSCDCLGVQDIHTITTRNDYRPNTNVAMGASKWLTMRQYPETRPCLQTLKDRGYRLVATTPQIDGFTPSTLPLEQPIALLFGTEETGLTEQALEMADDTLRLPMYGFTQSYNISVTVAVTLSRLIERLHESNVDWNLRETEREELTLAGYRQILKRFSMLEEQYLDQRDSSAK